MQEEIDILEFLQGVHFEFINSLKNDSTKFLLIFDESCAEIFNSKEFVPIPTTGRHRGFSTLYTTLSTKVNWKGMLSCKAHTIFFSSHLEMCIKLLH